MKGRIWVFGTGVAIALRLDAMPVPSQVKRDELHFLPKLAEDAMHMSTPAVFLEAPKELDVSRLTHVFLPKPSPPTTAPRVSVNAKPRRLLTKAKKMLESYPYHNYQLPNPFIERTVGWEGRNFPKPTAGQVQNQLASVSGGHKKSSKYAKHKMVYATKGNKALREKIFAEMQKALKNDEVEMRDVETELHFISNF